MLSNKFFECIYILVSTPLSEYQNHYLPLEMDIEVRRPQKRQLETNEHIAFQVNLNVQVS